MNVFQMLSVICIALTIAGCSKSAPNPASKGCGSDNDCKGDRICENAICVSPAAPKTKIKAAEATQEVKTTTPPPPELKSPAAVTKTVSKGPPRLGDANPLVTIVEYGDFQCKYCASATKTLRKVLEKYGTKGGGVAVEWRHNPLDIHHRALQLAYAAEAAHKQGRFWQFHDQLFANQKNLGAEHIPKYAKQAGLDIAQWEKDRRSKDIANAVATERHRAVALGATGTPTFFINGRALNGAQPIEAFDKLVGEELAKAKVKLDSKVERHRVSSILQRENNTKYAQLLIDGVLPPKPKRQKIPIDDAVWKVPVRSSDASIGPKDALVTIVEFGEYECVFTNNYRAVLNRILKAHPQDVRLVFKHHPLTFHKHAKVAAQAAIEAHAQGKFWEFHNALFDNQTQLKTEQVLTYAKTVGLNATQMAAAIQSGKHLERLESDMNDASEVEAIGTPNVFVNGRKVVGFREFAELEQLVVEELKKAQKHVQSGTPASKVYEKIVSRGQSKQVLASKKLSFTVADRPTKGLENAPIEMVVFTDFQCPFSSRLVPILNRTTKAFDGKVRTVFKHYPQGWHKDAQTTAEWSVCAQEQGKFWKLHAVLMDYENQKALKPADLKKYAKLAGLNTQKLAQCLASKRPKALIAADVKEAQAAGVKGTPTVYLNGKRFTSPIGYNDKSFTRVFTQLLKQ